MRQHLIKQGECVSSVAAAHGLLPATIWDHAANSELKNKRGDPNVLCPGDVLRIPDLREKEEDGSTGARHRFRRKSVPEILQVVLRVEGEPRADEKYSLIIDGKHTEGVTDAAGRVSIPIPPNAKRGKLKLLEGGEEFELDLGGLDPVDQISGVQARLANLGHQVEVTGEWDESSTKALQSFQRAQGLEVTSQPDEATRKSLTDAFGC